MLLDTAGDMLGTDGHEPPSFSSLVQTVTAAIIVVVLAIRGIDPLVGVFGSMAGVATVGMVVLMLTTSIAVLVFFVRNRDRAPGAVELHLGHRWQRHIEHRFGGHPLRRAYRRRCCLAPVAVAGLYTMTLRARSRAW